MLVMACLVLSDSSSSYPRGGSAVCFADGKGWEQGLNKSEEAKFGKDISSDALVADSAWIVVVVI
eukprot:scaffold160612_cov15-Tisochrysis_lutea.AAC.1